MAGSLGLWRSFPDEPLPTGLLVQVGGSLLGDEMVNLVVHPLLLRVW